MPVKINVIEERNAAKAYRVFWTPTIVITDADGGELHRDMGFLPADEFTSRTLLGLGCAWLQRKNIEAAAKCFDAIAADYGSTFAAPEAMYWKGVTTFKQTKDNHSIYEACQSVVKTYPDSEYAKKIGFVTKYKDFNLAAK